MTNTFQFVVLSGGKSVSGLSARHLSLACPHTHVRGFLKWGVRVHMIVIITLLGPVFPTM